MQFIEFVLLETKRFVGSNVNVILTRQTCGQHSSMSAGSKRWALAFYFSVRICHMLPISKCRADWVLYLCTPSVLAKRMPLHIGEFRRILRRNTFSIGSRPPAAALYLQVPKMYTDLDLICLCILILESYGKFVWKTNCWCSASAMLERWPHVCRVKITFGLLSKNRFVSTIPNSMKSRCKLESTENPRLFEKCPSPPWSQDIFFNFIVY